jgi:hypothetical protein
MEGRIMRIHSAPLLPLGDIVIVESGVVALVGRIADLRWEDGQDDSNVDIYLHPEEVEFFIATWFPSRSNRRLN